MKTFLLALPLALTLSACASYQPLSLQDQPTWKDTIEHVQVTPAQLGFPALPAHAFAPTAAGLDMTDVAILAVLNNPDLKLARDDARISHAQAFAASLLPDPQLAMSADFKLHPDPGSSRGYSIGPSFDFGSLFTHEALHGAATHEADKADMNLLWQEWQVIAQARLLYIRIVEGERLQKVLTTQQGLLQTRIDQVRQALAQHLITLDIANTVLTAQQDLQRQSGDLARQQNQTRHELNNLLGLAPTLQVPLQETLNLPDIDGSGVREILSQLPQRRPDLLALKRGYQAQDQRYRAAIIAQFPALSIGFTRTRDTSNVVSQGFGVNISLPLLNRNRGNIAIEQATRQRLHDEYQQRLNSAYADVDRLLKEQELDARQIEQLQAGMQQLQAQRANAVTAFHAGNLDTLMLLNIDTTLLARQTEAIALEQTMLEQRVALLGVIGGELPLTLKEKQTHE